MEKRIRVAWVSDFLLAPQGGGETLSAYCSNLLLPRLRERFDIELFSDLSPVVTVSEDSCRHYLTAIKRHAEQPFDLFFYQLEDHRSLRFVRSLLGVMPGVLWAHDLFLSDLGAEALHTSPWEQTIRKFHNSRVPFADRSKPPHQLAPLAHREVSLNPVVLCSSQRGMEAVRRISSDRLTTGSQGEFFFGYLPIPVSVTSRSRGGLRDSAVRIVTAASVGIEGRSQKFLEALRSFEGEWELTWLLDKHERDRAEGLVDEFGVSNRVSLSEGRTAAAWSQIVEQADVALHLHNGFFGHSGPYLQISMEAGVACITLRAVGGVDYPEDVVWTVVPGPSEALQIREAVRVCRQYGLPDSGQRGQSYVRSESDVAQVADSLAVTFERSVAGVSPVIARWNALYGDARDSLFQELKGLMNGPSSGVEEGVSPFDEIFIPIARELGW